VDPKNWVYHKDFISLSRLWSGKKWRNIMGKNTSEYIQGIQSINDFFEMLYAAMQSVMPNALLSKSGAWVWRGYRINEYDDLAYGQYYFQITPNDDPILDLGTNLTTIENNIQQDKLMHTPRFLEFKESYIEPNYQAVDSTEEQYGIKSGRYHDPFRLTLDLYQSRFFLFDVDEQYSLIRDFVDFACREAKLWQKSKGREKTTSDVFINGTRTARNTRKAAEPYNQIAPEYLTALRSQAFLFRELSSCLKQKLGNKVLWLRPNAQWRNWDFRGLRLKLKGLSQGKNADYLWEVYYDYDKKNVYKRPDRIACFSYNGVVRTNLGYFDILNTNYFDLSDDKKEKEMKSFINRVI
jgi:hypothetical protein